MAGQPHLFGFDPFADWAYKCRCELSRTGYKFEGAVGDEAIARAWLNVRRRTIEPRPRSVLRAREFTFSSEISKPLIEIGCRAERGQDLNCFLSKQLLDAEFQDKLLFDWDVHHFHLNLALDATGFSGRSRKLLFARVTPDTMYQIGIFDHGSWTDHILVEILHRNWPESIDAFRVPGILAPAQSFSAKELADLRRAGIQTFVHMSDGVTYAPLGGGYATDGSSAQVTQTLNSFRRYFRRLEEVIRLAEADIRARAWYAGINPGSLQLRLVHEGEQPFAQDDTARIRVRLPVFLPQSAGVDDGRPAAIDIL